MADFRPAMHVGGEWRDAANGGTLDVIDPATEEPIGRIAYGDAEDMRSAIDAATAAFASWRWTNAHARARKLRDVAAWLRTHADRLAATTTAESGKPLRDSRGEWAVAADLFDYYAEEGPRAEGRVVPAKLPGRRMSVLYQPIGVVGVVTAWNFPAYNPVRSVAAALAAGCAVVCRPSELTPYSGLALAEAAEAAGLPDGVLNVVNGEPAPMAAALLADPRVRKLSFTGSTRVGRELIAGSAETVTSLSLELGGNAPVIVAEDGVPPGGMDAFAEAAVAARTRNAGQVCIAPQRFYVHASLYDAFVEHAAEKLRAIRLGPGAEATTQMGPLINGTQRERVGRLVDDATGRGARVLVGGGKPDGIDAGYFYEPTLVVDTPHDAPLWREETFGPVLTVTPYNDLDDAVRQANSLEAGLAAYAFTRDTNRAAELAERLEFGMVALNGWLPQAVEAPFPGWKQSGLGAEAGPEGLHEYLATKVVSLHGLPAAW